MYLNSNDGNKCKKNHTIICLSSKVLAGDRVALLELNINVKYVKLKVTILSFS